MDAVEVPGDRAANRDHAIDARDHLNQRHPLLFHHPVHPHRRRNRTLGCSLHNSSGIALRIRKARSQRRHRRQRVHQIPQRTQTDDEHPRRGSVRHE